MTGPRVSPRSSGNIYLGRMGIRVSIAYCVYDVEITRKKDMGKPIHIADCYLAASILACAGRTVVVACYDSD